MSVIGPLATSSLSNMKAKLAHVHHLVPVMHCEKMDVTDIFRQSAVIEFHVKEGNSAGVIYERLRGV
jgi:hypothetical protein